MGDLTKNISRHELKCKCGNCDYQSVDYETIMLVQKACNHFAHELGVAKVTLNISSAARCFDYNRTPGVGSNDNSQHPRCSAIDHSIKGIDNKLLHDYYDGLNPRGLGLGLYDTFVHLDTRPTRARWGG